MPDFVNKILNNLGDYALPAIGLAKMCDSKSCREAGTCLDICINCPNQNQRRALVALARKSKEAEATIAKIG